MKRAGFFKLGAVLTLVALFTSAQRSDGAPASAWGPAVGGVLCAQAASAQDPPDADRDPARAERRRRFALRGEEDEGSFGPGRPGRPGGPMRLTPEQIERLMNFLKENLPALHDRLEELQLLDEETFRRRMHRIAPRIIEMARTKHEDPQLAGLMIEEFRMDAEIFELAHRYRTSTDADFRNEARRQMEELLVKQFATHHARQLAQLERLERRLAAQRQRLEEESEDRDQVIARRLNRILEGAPPPPGEEPPEE